MPKKLDLTGKVFGHLTVLHEADPYVSPKGDKQSRWACQCDCGKVIETNTRNLTSGQTKSCGHARLDYLKEKEPVTSLVGKVFSHLTVIRDDGTRKNKKVLWLCQCDCGNLTHVSGANLQSGGTTSCGHVEKANRDAYHEKVRTEEPGTNLDLLGNKPSKNSELHERNISIKYSGGKKRYRVAIMYKRHQYGGLRDTMEEAIELREHLRRKYWPNYSTEK